MFCAERRVGGMYRVFHFVVSYPDDERAAFRLAVKPVLALEIDAHMPSGPAILAQKTFPLGADARLRDPEINEFVRIPDLLVDPLADELLRIGRRRPRRIGFPVRLRCRTR